MKIAVNPLTISPSLKLKKVKMGGVIRKRAVESLSVVINRRNHLIVRANLKDNLVVAVESVVVLRDFFIVPPFAHCLHF